MQKALFNLVYNRKKKLLSNGTALVQVEAYMSGRKKYFSTSVYLTPEQWDQKHRKIRNHPNAIRLNKQIADFVATLERVELDRLNAGKSFTLDTLNDSLKGGFTNSFTDFMRDEIEHSKLGIATKRAHLTTLKCLLKFKGNIYFDELTYELLSDLERFLRKKELRPNSVLNYFKHIRKYTNLAINKDLFDLNRYPFRKFKIKGEATSRAYLSPEELLVLEKLELPSDDGLLRKTLDMFLFSCYTGLRFSDVTSLSVDDIRVVDGLKWIERRMLKTNDPIRIPLSLLFDGRPVAILEKYIVDGHKFMFDDLSNKRINRRLKNLAALGSIRKSLTFHVARHTHATYLLNKGMNITTIQKMLGHKKIQTTQIYSKVMDVTIVNELARINFN